jgi:tricorn protease
MDPAWVGNAVYFRPIATAFRMSGATTRVRAVRVVTKFTDFDVKTLDARSDAVVFEQAGYIHELNPATGRSRIVEVRATGDFPWMMPRWDDVTGRIANVALSPTGKRVVVEARGEIFTIPAEKGDTRNITHSSGSSEIAPIWPRMAVCRVLQHTSGSIAVHRAAGSPRRREIVLPEPSRPYSPAWSPNGRRIAFQDSHFTSGPSM